jgi:hypothetical protein
MSAGVRRLKIDLLGHIQSVIYLNPEISDGAFQLRMADGPDVLRLERLLLADKQSLVPRSLASVGRTYRPSDLL